MYLVSARKKGTMGVVADTATKALWQRQSFEIDGFQTTVFDELGRECPLDQLQAQAENEARARNAAGSTPHV